MPWIIDKDHFNKAGDPYSLPSRKGWLGSRSYKGDGSELTFKFKMYTDDHELMYSGRAHEMCFDPLDHLGTPDAGCTEIWYLNPATGKWEQL